MKELIDSIETSLCKANQYLESKVSTGQLFRLHDIDLACCFKLPMFFIECGKPDLAKRVLDFICAEFLMVDGDFKTNKDIKSIKPEYVEYWTYFNGWIFRAAELLHYSLPDAALLYFKSYYMGDGRFFSNCRQLSNAEFTDVLTVAHHGLFYLEQGHAWYNEAAIFLCDAFDRQPELDHQFILRFDKLGLPICDFDTHQQLFFSVEKNRGVMQLYFMTAYPCAFLALCYRKTGDSKFLDYAKRYMDFMLSCGEESLASRFSHKTAWAASILYAETGEEKYLIVIQTVVQYFLGMQSIEGGWFVVEGENVSYDQTAEVGCWFAQIIKNINMRLCSEESYVRTMSGCF